jgi:hypothetical protein
LWQSIGIKNSNCDVEALYGGLMIPLLSSCLSLCGGFALVVGTIEKRNPKTKSTDCPFSGTFSLCTCTNGHVLTAQFWLPKELRAKTGSQQDLVNLLN